MALTPPPPPLLQVRARAADIAAVATPTPRSGRDDQSSATGRLFWGTRTARSSRAALQTPLDDGDSHLPFATA